MQLSQRLGQQRGQRPRQRVQRGLVAGHVQVQPTVLGHKVGIGRPFLAVHMQPRGSAVLQFHQGSKLRWAVFRRAQLFAADPRQIQDRRSPGWRCSSDKPRVDAAQPKGRAAAAMQVVAAELIELWQQRQQFRHHARPQAVRIRP